MPRGRSSRSPLPPNHHTLRASAPGYKVLPPVDRCQITQAVVMDPSQSKTTKHRIPMIAHERTFHDGRQHKVTLLVEDELISLTSLRHTSTGGGGHSIVQILLEAWRRISLDKLRFPCHEATISARIRAPISRGKKSPFSTGILGWPTSAQKRSPRNRAFFLLSEQAGREIIH